MREGQERRRTITALAVIGLLIAAGCSGDSGDDDTTDDTGSEQAALVLEPPDVVEDGFEYVWNPLRMGAGGFVTGVVLHPTEADVRIVRTDVGGVYGWDADVDQWRQLLTGDGVPDADDHPGDYQVESMALSPSDPSVIYIAGGADFNPGEGEVPAGNGRVLRSDDGGDTWTAGEQRFFVAGNQEYRQLGERLGVDPEDPDHVLFGTRREGLWESTDGGLTFAQVPVEAVPVGGIGETTQDQPGVMFVSWDRETPGRVFVGVSGAGVYRSDDAGATWRVVEDLGGTATVPAEGQVVGGRLVVAFNDGGDGVPATVRIYDPDADSWHEVTPPLDAPWWAFAVDPGDPNRMAAVALQMNDGQLWRSVDGGASWTSAAVLDSTTRQIPWIEQATQGTFAVVGRLVFDPLGSGEIFWGDGSGLYRVADMTADPAVLVIDSVGIEELVASEIVAPAGGDPVTGSPTSKAFPRRRERISDKDAGRRPVHRRYGSRLQRRESAVARVGRCGVQPVLVSRSPGARRLFRRRRRNLDPVAQSRPGVLRWEVAVSATDPENIVWLPSYFESADEWMYAPKGFYVTKDRGGSWTHVPDVDGVNNFHRLMWWLSRQALAADKVDGGVFALMADDERFYVSTDGGETWGQAANSPPCSESNDCHVLGQLAGHPGAGGRDVGRGRIRRPVSHGRSRCVSVGEDPGHRRGPRLWIRGAAVRRRTRHRLRVRPGHGRSGERPVALRRRRCDVGARRPVPVRPVRRRPQRER